MSSCSQKLWVETSTTRYPIYIGEKLTSSFLSCDDDLFEKGLIVTDDTVAHLYLSKFRDSFKNQAIQDIVLPHGEEHKNLNQLTSILDTLAQGSFHRDDVLIAFGGGVIGDLSGMAASLFHRGMRLWQFPTTLLAQVDAAVGGKTAINYAGEKNSVGTFYQPQAVFCDITVLKTLSPRAYRSAFSEIVKYALLDSEKFFYFLDKNIEPLKAQDPTVLQQVIAKCCKIKAAIICEDERELGARALLNLGHTFAHAIETATDYRRYYHGEAVAIGIVLAVNLSVKLGYLNNQKACEILKLIKKLGLPVSFAAEIEIDALLSLMKRDKKVRQSKVRFVLLNNIGEAFVDTVCDEEIVSRVLLEARSLL